MKRLSHQTVISSQFHRLQEQVLDSANRRNLVKVLTLYGILDKHIKVIGAKNTSVQCTRISLMQQR